ncbi:MAG: hypothetical protein ACO2ZK_04525, partial [Gemmobacter sp.]
ARDWRYLVARAVQIARHGGAARVPPERKAIRRLVRRTGRIDIAEGYGGVVVRPSFFDASFREIPPVLWAVDDVWISGNLARRGVPILAVADAAQLRFMAEHHAPDALHQVAIEGAARFDANRRCALWMQEHLGVWR